MTYIEAMTSLESSSVEAAFASLKLKGARFDGAKIPVETLEELIRYRQLIIAAAEDSWKKDHPGEDAPEALKDGLGLSLTDVVDGSSVPLLEREAGGDFDELFEDGKDNIDQLLRYVTEGELEAIAFPEWADIDPFWEFGSSLAAGEEMQVPAPVEEHSRFATISPVSRAQRFSPLKSKLHASPARSESFGLVEGRVIALNAEKRNFDVSTQTLGELRGKFRTVDITSELREFLGNSSEAPEVLILGRLGFKEQALDKIHEATLVVELGDPFEKVARKLEEISRLKDGWLEGAGSSVRFELLRLGSRTLSTIKKAGLAPPNVFPTEEGGLSFEWATGTYVLSVEIEADSSIAAYSLLPGDTTGTETSVRKLENLSETIDSWKEVLGD
ncbi:MAG TPA: hypothetical protein VFC72_03515 [Corynebacterium sp.]|nr:hypothetical protein [Corynebacterium sp.]